MKGNLFETFRRGDFRFAGRGRLGSEDGVESGRGGRHGHTGGAHHSPNASSRSV